MSRYYDNWERLVAAVLRREQDRKTCFEQSITTSFRSSISTDFNYSVSFSNPSFDFENRKDGLVLRSAQTLPFQTLAGIRRSTVIMKPYKLVHRKGSPFAFGLEELLMAPSFALGEDVDTFMSTYAVSFKDGTTIVVKRLTRDFTTYEVWHQRYRTIDSIEHQNVVTWRGYFYNEDEGFYVYDYFHQGNLHTMLHEKKGETGSVRLDWEGRMNIAIGAAKGLHHIHKQSGDFVHGSVKSSNIFINSEEYGCINIKPELEINHKNRLYHAPEVLKTKEFSRAGDVYSFGVVLIELLSGRSSMRYFYESRHETFGDWALHCVRDEWTTIVFDRELLKYSLVKQGMKDLLGVALSCLKRKPEERPDMKHVVEMLQLIPTTFPV